jgi:hypothetical protein
MRDLRPWYVTAHHDSTVTAWDDTPPGTAASITADGVLTVGGSGQVPVRVIARMLELWVPVGAQPPLLAAPGSRGREGRG